MSNVVVVGSTSGIAGAVIGRYLEDGGNRVATLGRRPAEHPGIDYHGHLDAERLDTVSDAFHHLNEEFGPIDIAVNCIGVWGYALVTDIRDDDLRSMCAINLTAAIAAIREEVARMSEGSGGAIVTVTSAVGTSGAGAGLGVYAATKAGIAAFTRCAAVELAPRGVRLNCVAPGPVRTEMTRLPGESDGDREDRLGALVSSGRMAGAGEIASAITWLASDSSSYVNGTELLVHSGGFAS